MESEHLAIEALVKEVKEAMFPQEEGNFDVYSYVSPSAYDTAWLAMVPDPDLELKPDRPMFTGCLDWIMDNQKEEGFWGDYDAHGMPTIESLPSTLACIIALKKWNFGSQHVEKGLEFIQKNSEKIMGQHFHEQHCPRWFAIMFPAMVELAREQAGLELYFTSPFKRTMLDIFYLRQRILESEELVDQKQQYPLLSYLEALSSTYDINHGEIEKYLRDDGSLFQSPSATACAFILTGNSRCQAYLRSLANQCANRVPATFPLDEELIKLCVVNQIQRMGLAEHFKHEIDDTLEKVYRTYTGQQYLKEKPITNSCATKLYKDSLAFRMLRMHGYRVSPGMFCWFLNNKKIQDRIETDHENFSNVMLNVYRATDLAFAGENELEEARSFSRKLLEKNSFQRTIEDELSVPWIARMEHLEHRMRIEDSDSNALWKGKASFLRLLGSSGTSKLMQLAIRNFEFRQSVYQKELDELKRWTKEHGLSCMGFAREKTSYLYFAVASSTMLPHDSLVRKILTKSAILVVVADDFFDIGGSLEELQTLTDALQRWDSNGLTGHSKTIFDALDDLVNEIAIEHFKQSGIDVTSKVRHLWHETFVSWLIEAVWSKAGHRPSIDEYVRNGMVSVAIQTMVLPASCLLNQTIPNRNMNPGKYQPLTKLLMIACRLLNDFRGYKKEQEHGKLNSVLLHMTETSDTTDIENSVSYIGEIIDKKTKDFLEHVLIDTHNDLPRPCKNLHLSCLRFYEMFYSSSNKFESETDLLQDIQKAIYVPLNVEMPKLKKTPMATLRVNKPLKGPTCWGSTKKIYKINFLYESSTWHGTKTSIIAAKSPSQNLKAFESKNVFMPAKFGLAFI